MIDFYTGSGSPFGWRVWLALEALGVPYRLHMMSFSSGELKAPPYRAIHPRGRVPALVDDGFTLWESAAIVEYLNDVHGRDGARVIPREPRAAATVRRAIREIDADYVPANEELVEEILYQSDESVRDASRIARARAKLAEELAMWSERLEAREGSGWLVGELSAADHALYPLVALTLRMEKRHPALAIAECIRPPLRHWMDRFEKLPSFERTYPPHWR